MQCSIYSKSDHYIAKPFIDGAKIFYGGSIQPWTRESKVVTSPILDTETGERIPIGQIAQMDGEEAMKAYSAAQEAWNKGRGIWPQLPLFDRIQCIQNLVVELKKKRDEIIQVLMWEICKSLPDATTEFDRTMQFIDATIEAVKDMDQKEGQPLLVSGIRARVRRAAVGVMLAMGPFNYPFNETYTTLIPALIMGNVVVMKIPGVGGLAHVVTMEAFATAFPPGVMNFISGSGRETMTPIMQAGVDMFAFIGGSRTADATLKAHPEPHRLKFFLSLEGKNLGIVTDDADIDVAVEQCALGSLTYNGQRCTAIKMIFVHQSKADLFIEKFCQRVKIMKAGLPWEEGVVLTSLPQPGKVNYLLSLIEDAKNNGGVLVNEADGGGSTCGSLMFPAIISPVTKEMRLWHEEQFGPVVPIAIYKDIEEVHDYISAMPFGQQASIFSTTVATTTPLIDILSNVVGRININTQCGRSPDFFPFSGRRSSANGTLSVTEAIRTFSIETVLAAKSNEMNDYIFFNSECHSNFLNPLDGRCKIPDKST